MRVSRRWAAASGAARSSITAEAPAQPVRHAIYLILGRDCMEMTEASPRAGWQRGVEWTAALALAALWFSAGIWKLSDLTATQVRMTQALVPQSLSLVVAAFFGAAETLAGILLLAPRWRRWGA